MKAKLSASPFLDEWLGTVSSESLRDLSKYWLTQNSWFFIDAPIDNVYKLNPEQSDVIPEIFALVPGKCASPDGVLGKSLPEGKHFIDLVNQVAQGDPGMSKQDLDSRLHIAKWTRTKDFFDKNLAELINSSNKVLYADPYLWANFEGENPRPGLVDWLMDAAAPGSQIQLFGGRPTKNVVYDWDSKVTPRLTSMVTERDKAIGLNAGVRKLNHSRYLRLSFGSSFFFWELSFSADRWAQETFGLVSRMDFQRCHKEINSYLLQLQRIPGFKDFSIPSNDG